MRTPFVNISTLEAEENNEMLETISNDPYQSHEIKTTDPAYKYSIPSSRLDNLRYTGLNQQWANGPENLAIRKKVYEQHVANSRAAGKPYTYLLSKAKKEIREVDKSGQYLVPEAATWMEKLLSDARNELAANIKITILSGYRNAEDQFSNWVKSFPSYFYWAVNKAGIAKSDIKGLANYVGGSLAAPGFSNHNHGLAVDFRSIEGAKTFTIDTNPDHNHKAAWKKNSQFWAWLNENAHKYYFYPYEREPWHWEFKPGRTTVEKGTDQLISYEFDVPASLGTTLYLPVSVGGQLPAKTGVFIPAGFNAGPRIDVIVFLHGHMGGYDAAKNWQPNKNFAKRGIEYYWKNQANIREYFRQSKRNAILIAPTLGSKSSASFGNLGTKKGFDDFINACFFELNKTKIFEETKAVYRIILAAHSGGGNPMGRILISESNLVNNIEEVWGFDCLYSPWPDNYKKWAKTLPRYKSPTRTFHFYHYWAYFQQSKGTPGRLADGLQKDFPILIKNVEPKKYIQHDPIIQWAWLNEINKRQWFTPIPTTTMITPETEQAESVFTNEGYDDHEQFEEEDFTATPEMEEEDFAFEEESSEAEANYPPGSMSNSEEFMNEDEMDFESIESESVEEAYETERYTEEQEIETLFEHEKAPPSLQGDIMHDGFSRPILDEEIIGLDSDANLNIHLTTDAADALKRKKITMKIIIRAPKKPKDRIISKTIDVPKIGPDPLNPGTTIFRGKILLTKLGKIIQPLDDQVKEIATVRRIGGTSDGFLLSALGAAWQRRGQGEQPGQCGGDSTLWSEERPDALNLIRAGGISIVELVDSSGNIKARRFIRNPADIFYYTGHGLGIGFSRNNSLPTPLNCLAIEDQPDHYCCWVTPADLKTFWKNKMDLDTFIIAGCSVLGVDGSKTPLVGDGLEWAKLLQINGGPLRYLLGYGDWDDGEPNDDGATGPHGHTAPLDSNGGNEIAKEIGTWIKSHPNLTGIIKQWLTINASKHLNFQAVGMDKDGVFYRTRRKLTPGWKLQQKISEKTKKGVVNYVIESKKI